MRRSPSGTTRTESLGVTALEDKVVQGAAAEVVTDIYEVDFLVYSYGFRPGRSLHQTLLALHPAFMTQNANRALEAHFRSCFDSGDHPE